MRIFQHNINKEHEKRRKKNEELRSKASISFMKENGARKINGKFDKELVLFGEMEGREEIKRGYVF